MELFIGPAISGMAVTACKIAEISFKLANVDDQISVYENILANNSETVRSVRQQIATKKKYLSCRELNDYYRALDNSDKALDGIRDLISKVRTDAGPDGSLATMQKVTWSLRDAQKAAERVTLITNCHTTMERILITLSAIPSRGVLWAQKMHKSVPDYHDDAPNTAAQSCTIGEKPDIYPDDGYASGNDEGMVESLKET